MAGTAKFSTEEREKRALAVIEGIAERRETLRVACAAAGISTWQFLEAVAANPDTAKQYARAMEVRAEAEFEELLEIADEEPGQVTTQFGGHVDSGDVANRKLRIEARQWRIARMYPKKYGNRASIEHSGHVETEKPRDFSRLTADELQTLEALEAKSRPAEG